MSEQLILPSIQNIIVNKEFLGLGHRLADRHRQRKQIDDEAQQLSNRVGYLEKQNSRAEREMREKQERLRQILDVKRRQSEERQQKDRLRQQKQQQIDKARELSFLYRMQHRMNLNQNITEVYQQNKHQAEKGKQQKKERQMLRSQQKSEDLSHKQDLYYMINELKEDGKRNIIDYRRQKNQEHIMNYQERMKKEEQIKLRKLSLMNQLEQKESQLIDKLQKSSQAHEAMDKKFNEVQHLAVNELEKIMTEHPKKREASHKPMSRQSYMTEDKTETGSNKPARSRLDLEGYRRKLSQISHTLDILDKPFLLDELIVENAQSLGRIPEHPTERKKRKQRKRRYHPQQ